MSAPEAVARPEGRIVTFYSYKGGTGRSMALANVAWILASNGLRVLVIDWDLEAPGLHRYFHPFLSDKELTSSAGLIDWFVDVSIAARDANGAGPDWWRAWTSLLSYTYSLDWEFPAEGTIDFVPAGRQGGAYAERVSSFDWRGFYEKLGGGILLEGLKQELRRDYDYVLIDSRTGISDTSGICTVQMPDDLVVCFTLNQQSVKGAAAAADSAWTQRFKPSGAPGLRVWPVPMRIELAEKERLEAAGEAARQVFQRYLMHLPRAARDRYWDRVQVLYQPFFAYEEVLAPFVERQRHSGSMLGSVESLASALSDGRVTTVGAMSERARADGFARLTAKAPQRSSSTATRSLVYVSYPITLREPVYALIRRLNALGVPTFSDQELQLGDDRVRVLNEGMDRSAVVLAVVGPWSMREGQLRELERAVANGKRLVPVLMAGAKWAHVPELLRSYQGVELTDDEDGARTAELARSLMRLIDRGAASEPIDPDDPQKGCWGGRAEARGRQLLASVREVANGWFRIALEVRSTGDQPLDGEVVFHLHPTFPSPVMRVLVSDGRARLWLAGWGAFTVGAEADDGQTTLELDLAADLSLPAAFRER